MRFAAVVGPRLAGTAYALRREPALGLARAWCFGIPAPTSLAPGTIQMIVEHRRYLPLAAVVAVVVVLRAHRPIGRHALSWGPWSPSPAAFWRRGATTTTAATLCCGARPWSKARRIPGRGRAPRKPKPNSAAFTTRSNNPPRPSVCGPTSPRITTTSRGCEPRRTATTRRFCTTGTRSASCRPRPGPTTIRPSPSIAPVAERPPSPTTPRPSA